MKLFFTFTFLLILTSSASDCKNFIFEARKDAYLENYENLSRYQGHLRETQNQSSILYEVFWEKPNRFYSRIIEAKEYKGSVVNWNGNTLRLYFPKTKFGIEFLHLEIPSGEQQQTRDLLSDVYDWNLKHFEPELKDGEIIADRQCAPIRYKPILVRKYFQEWEICLYNDFSFPMRVSLFDKNGSMFFEREFVSVRFNEPIPSKQFGFDFPPRTNVVIWNLKSKQYKIDEPIRQTGIPLVFPKVPEGFELQKIVKLSAQIPGFLFLYKKGPYFIGLTQTKEIGLRTIDLPKGSYFSGIRPMELHFFGIFSSFSFVQNKIRFFLFSNLPYQELGEIADTIPEN